MKRLGVAAILCIFTYFAVADCPEGFVAEYNTDETTAVTLDDVASEGESRVDNQAEESSFNCVYVGEDNDNTRFEYRSDLENDFGPDRDMASNQTSIEADPALYTDVDPEVTEYFNLPDDSSKNQKEYPYDDENEDRAEMDEGAREMKHGAKDAGEDIGRAGKDAGEDIGEAGKKTGEDVGEAGKKTGEDVGEAGKDAGESADRGAKKVEKGAKDVGKGAKDVGKTTYKSGKEAGKSIGKGVSKGAEEVGEGAKDAGKAVGDVFSSDKDRDRDRDNE